MSALSGQQKRGPLNYPREETKSGMAWTGQQGHSLQIYFLSTKQISKMREFKKKKKPI